MYSVNHHHSIIQLFWSSLHWETMTKVLFILLLICTLQMLTYTVLSLPSSSSSTEVYPSGYGDEYSSSSGSTNSQEHDQLIPPRREVYGNGRIIDITHKVRSDLPGFGSTEGVGQLVRLASSMKNGSFANVSELKLLVHTGTHVDAPGHYIDRYFDAGFDVDSLDLDVLNGPALLVDVPRDKNITAEVMESLNIPRGVCRVLFRTLNTDRKLMWKKEFDTSYVGFMKDGAQWLIDNTDIKMVGVDYLSVAAFDNLISAHIVFLEGRETIIVEGLKLDDINPGLYSVHCLPMRLVGAEGAPTRCILIK